MDFKRWFESYDDDEEDDFDREDDEDASTDLRASTQLDKYINDFVQKIITHLGGKPKNFLRWATPMGDRVGFEFTVPCGVYANRIIRMQVKATFDNLKPWRTECYLTLNVHVPQMRSLRKLYGYIGFNQGYNINLLKAPKLLAKIPQRFKLESTTKFPGIKHLRQTTRKVVPTTWTQHQVITVTRFEPEAVHNGYVWVYVQGWLTKDERFQFQGQVEFSVKPDGSLYKIVDSSPLEFIAPGAEKAILRGLNYYAQSQKPQM